MAPPFGRSSWKTIGLAAVLGLGGLLVAGLELMHSNGDSPPSSSFSSRFREVQGWTSPRLKQALAKLDLEFGAPIYIRIFKESRELELWVEHSKQRVFHLFKTYPIAAFSGQLGPKLKEGDRQAPEGFYYVPPGMMNPRSRLFNLGYPNAYDRAHGRNGSYLMVHGDKVSIGCYAMTDPLIEEIYTLADAALGRGQAFFRVHCFPFRMTEERLRKARAHPREARWHAFWMNLKEGYDHFEKWKTPPDVTVKNKRHQFSRISS